LNDFNLLKVIHPTLTWGKPLLKTLNATKQVLSWYDLLFLDESYMKWAVYFLVLLQHCEKGAAEEICDRFELAPRLRQQFVKGRANAERCLYWLGRGLPKDNSGLYQRLAGFKTELILFMMAATDQEQVKKAISLFFTKLRRTAIALKGEDLKALGLEPGPVYRQIFQAVFAAKLNGRVGTHEEEIELAKSLARRG
jgi:tRNA nucleotidyltransferase (CCA-adding enzyme)